MLFDKARAAVTAALIFSVIVLPACSKRNGAIPVATPLPSNPPAQASCVTGLSTMDERRRTASATPTPLPVVASQVTIDSNPRGLQVEVDGSFVGKTSLAQTPSFSTSLHQITVFNGAGGPDYEVCFDQAALPNLSLFYNRNADTLGKVTSLQSIAVSPDAQTVVRQRVGIRSSGTRDEVPDLIGVVYKPQVLSSERRLPDQIESQIGLGTGRTISSAGAPQLTRVVAVPSAQRDTVLAQLRARSDVLAAAPIHYRYLQTVTPIAKPNDTHFTTTQQWDMFQIGMLSAWAYPSGFGSPSVQVAVIDTGLDTRAGNTSVQADLVPKLTFAESVINGVTTTGQAAVQDNDGHGTNVAGIAVASANNNVGFAGVAPAVKLQVYDIFSGGSATTADEAQAIYDAVAHGAQVINMSLGGCEDGGPDPTEETAVEFALNNNVLVVAAAGNERGGGGTCANGQHSQNLDFPAGYPGVMAVGATSLNDGNTCPTPTSATCNPSGAKEQVASYSNSGPGLGVVAPGGDPTGTSDPDVLHWITNLYSTTGSPPCSLASDCAVLIAGTSQATPHVTGAAALLLSVDPTLSPAQLESVLDSTADDIGDPNQGHGRLDVYRAVALVQGDANPPPYKPSNAQLVAFAYSNSGAANAAPQILDETFPGGITVNADGTFRIADIPTSATGYKIGVWYDANDDGVIDAGDYFGASGACTASTPCASAAAISVTKITSSNFVLP